MNILLCDMHVTCIGKASPLMRYTNMVELSDSFKQRIGGGEGGGGGGGG